MASIKLVLRTNQEDKTGHSPLYIRLIKDRKTKFIVTGIKLKENEWDDVKQKVKRNYPNSTRMNAFLSQKIADAEAMVADNERKRGNISAKRLKEAIKGKDIKNFFEYAYERCERVRGNVSPQTYKAYKMNIQKFEKFLGTNEIYFEDITVTVLNDYVNFMSNRLKNGSTTMHYALNILAIMFKDAIREEVISLNTYPFASVRIKKDKSTRLFLNKEQIEQLKNHKSSFGQTDTYFRDMFIFSCYAGGLRFSDVVTLQWKNYNEAEQRISLDIRKTHRSHQFKIGQTAIEILNKYKTENSQPDDFIFPIIQDDDFFLKTREYQAKYISNKNALCGQKLRRMGKELEFPFSLQFHLSRHTFATQALANGMRIEYVSKLLDHSDIGITQIYAKIVNEELDKAVEKYIL
ncbi:site-specific integrase [Empedobacter sp.]|uniref:site-specific integrase n=1 Tax=Empedobacter sp. TaxID=1927715 RepID=UPI000E85DF43|nr:site-specific integrase [Empedobacter sp.]HBX63651.1 recombinase [Flavobacteriaceae bacterium]